MLFVGEVLWQSRDNMLLFLLRNIWDSRGSWSDEKINTETHIFVNHLIKSDATQLLVVLLVLFNEFCFCDKQLEVEFTWRFKHMIIINYSLWKHKIVNFAAADESKSFRLIFFLLPYGQLYHINDNCFEISTTCVLVFNIYFN